MQNYLNGFRQLGIQRKRCLDEFYDTYMVLFHASQHKSPSTFLHMEIEQIFLTSPFVFLQREHYDKMLKSGLTTPLTTFLFFFGG